MKPAVDNFPARIHLLPAKHSTKVLVLRRKPSRWVHVMLWDTADDSIEHGSWFKGKLEMLESDLSYDGELMVYGARNNSKHEQWTGVCRPPWLKTVLDLPSAYSVSGGYFDGPDSLRVQNVGPFGPPRDLFTVFENLFPGAFGRRSPNPPPLPIRLAGPPKVEPVGYLPTLFLARLERDGWRRNGPLPKELQGSVKERRPGDPGWSWKFSDQHPTLSMFYEGWLQNAGPGFRFSLGDDLHWATWSSLGNLLLSRGDAIERWTLDDLQRGEPTFQKDLSYLEPRSTQTEDLERDQPERRE